MTVVPGDDATLWSHARAGDAAAFARLFDSHRDAVYRQALRLLRRVEDAEDVASAAFFELWRRRDAVVLVDGSVRPWLLVTTANLARNAHRSVRRYEALLRRAEDESTAGQAPAQLVGARGEPLDRLVLVEALSGLRRIDAALITLTVLDGYRVQEVAALVGLSDGAARARLLRARRKLQAVLREPDVASATVGEGLSS